MSMLDDLEAEPSVRPGPLCIFQKIRNVEGEERYRDIMAVLLTETRTSGQKQRVLLKHGYDIHRGTIERHTKERLGDRNGCVRCHACLS
jgi:hypothetical protein